MMKRNLDLIRHILLIIEDSSSDRLTISDFITEEYPGNVVSHHLKLLLDCGYIDAVSRNTIGAPYTMFIVHRMTSQGYDYLEAVKDNSIWDKTKTKLLELGGTATLDTVKTISSSIALKMLGL